MNLNRSVVCVLICLMLVSLSAFAIELPFAYWNLDESEGTTAKDQVGTLNGTWVGNAVWAPDAGEYGGAIECNDDSSFLTIDDSDEIFEVLGTEFTFSVWVNVTEFTSDYQGIIGKDGKFYLERNNTSSQTIDAVHFKCIDETGVNILNLYGGVIINDDEWHHVVAIYAEDSAYLYVDGELDVEGEATGEPVGYVEHPLLIGGIFEDAAYRNSWNGMIDEVRIYNFALTAEEVVELYNLEIDTKVETSHDVIGDYSLEQNYPNPFNPGTKISFSLTKPEHVTLRIINTTGQHISTLLDEEKNSGIHSVYWNTSGQELPSGVYFYQLTVGNYSKTRKMILVQ